MERRIDLGQTVELNSAYDALQCDGGVILRRMVKDGPPLWIEGAVIMEGVAGSYGSYVLRSGERVAEIERDKESVT